MRRCRKEGRDKRKRKLKKRGKIDGEGTRGRKEEKKKGKQ